MSDLPTKPASYDVGGWIKWLEAHCDHLMAWKRSMTESASEPAPQASDEGGGASVTEVEEPPKG